MVGIGRALIDDFAFLVGFNVVAPFRGTEGRHDFRNGLAVLVHKVDGISLFRIGLRRGFLSVDLLFEQRLECVRFSVQVILQGGDIIF